MKISEIEKLETKFILEALSVRYGYDFHDYSQELLYRRVTLACEKFDCKTLSDLLKRVLHDDHFYLELVMHMTIGVTEMFRDPDFFQALRDVVVPHLATYPSLKIWHAGCSTGEEVYSLAILLQEEGLLDRSVIYATDINPQALKTAKNGIYHLDDFKGYIENYRRAGGQKNFSEYYHADYGAARMDASLRSKIIFAEHNLVTDGSFAEMHLILCRNVMIYFNKSLQNKVLKLFSDSLRSRGFLCLGQNESLRFTGLEESFKELSSVAKIYRENSGLENRL